VNWKKVLVVLIPLGMALFMMVGCSTTEANTSSSGNTSATTVVTSTATGTETNESSVPSLAVVDLADVIAASASVGAINTEVSYSSFFGAYTEDGAAPADN
jgi:uncharacterized protein YcfL